MTLDAHAKQLHDDGWSAGDMAIRTIHRVIWCVFAHRDEQRIVVKAENQAEAWNLAAGIASRIYRLM